MLKKVFGQPKRKKKHKKKIIKLTDFATVYKLGAWNIIPWIQDEYGQQFIKFLGLKCIVIDVLIHMIHEVRGNDIKKYLHNLSIYGPSLTTSSFP